jgi:hypothetical protein
MTSFFKKLGASNIRSQETTPVYSIKSIINYNCFKIYKQFANLEIDFDGTAI